MNEWSASFAEPGRCATALARLGEGSAWCAPPLPAAPLATRSCLPIRSPPSPATDLAHVAAGDEPGPDGRAALLGAHVLVKDGCGDGQGGHRVGHVHDARDAALAGAAGQQQVDLPAGQGRAGRAVWCASRGVLRLELTGLPAWASAEVAAAGAGCLGLRQVTAAPLTAWCSQTWRDSRWR